MKKILFLTTLALLISCANVKGQDMNGVYFVFTSTPKGDIKKLGTGKVYRDTISTRTPTEGYKNKPIMFEIRLEIRGGISLWHYERIRPVVGQTEIPEKQKHKVYLKEESFLNEVTCYKWDDIKNTEIKEWHILMESLVFGRTLYVVDHRETQNGIIKIYQVANMSYR